MHTKQKGNQLDIDKFNDINKKFNVNNVNVIDYDFNIKYVLPVPYRIYNTFIKNEEFFPLFFQPHFLGDIQTSFLVILIYLISS